MEASRGAAELLHFKLFCYSNSFQNFDSKLHEFEQFRIMILKVRRVCGNGWDPTSAIVLSTHKRSIVSHLIDIVLERFVNMSY